MSNKLFRFPRPVPFSPSAPSMSLTQASRSSHRNFRGFRASTICTIKWERSITRHSCLHTSRLRSKGVSKNLSLSCNLTNHVKINDPYKQQSKIIMRTLPDLFATEGTHPFPDAPAAPDLQIQSMEVFLEPATFAYFRHASLAWIFLLALKVRTGSGMSSQKP